MEIEKGIAIPEKSELRKGLYITTAKKMQVNDSVVFDKPGKAASLKKALGRLGHKAESRKVPKGWRVWRTA